MYGRPQLATADDLDSKVSRHSARGWKPAEFLIRPTAAVPGAC